MLDKYAIKDLQKLSKAFEKNLNKLCWDFYDIPISDATNKQINKFEYDLIKLIFDYWDDVNTKAHDEWYDDEDEAYWDRSGIWDSVKRDIRGKNIVLPEPYNFEMRPNDAEHMLGQFVRDLYYEDFDDIDGDWMYETLLVLIEG